MNKKTKEAIISGLELGTIGGVVTGGQTLFALNGMGHIPFNIIVNGIFPAVAAIGGFIAGYKFIKNESCVNKDKSNKNREIITGASENSEISLEKQLEYLKEQRNILTGNVEKTNKRPKVR